VTALSRQARLLVTIAGVSLLAIVAGYLLPSSDRWARTVLADAARTWASLYATGCCYFAARRVAQRTHRRMWLWIGSGCLLFLPGQLVWSYYELYLRQRPPYPSFADAGFLGIYACFAVALLTLLREQPRRRRDAAIGLDILLVTFTTGALTYHFLLRPALTLDVSDAAFWTSVAWAVAPIAVLWTILLQMLSRTRFPLSTTGSAILGLILTCASSVLYSGAALRGAFQSGGALDLGWDAGLLVIAGAAAIAADRPAADSASTPALSGYAARTIAVLVGLAGIAGVAVAGALQPRPSVVTAVLVALGGCIIGARFIATRRADRRYAELLEQEGDSLAATATAERNLRLVIESVPDAITVLDREGRLIDFNTPARAALAAGGEPRPGGSVFDSFERDAAAVVRAKLAAAFQGEVQRFDVPCVRADGTRGHNTVVYAPVREGGRVTSVLALARDVTDQKRTESQLQQAEKLAAMAQLVGGVAHEINNPAAIISGFAQTLLLDELKHEHREMVQMIYDEATRIGRITSSLLAFAHAGSKQRALVDVNDIVRRTFALRSYHLSTLNITVLLELDVEEPKLWADASELQQLLLNLLMNAEQALMTIEATRTITVRSRSDDKEVRLEVADSGPGIGADMRGKLFDPFFTSKPEGLGTGLGLSICYGIAQEHGGRIWVESEPGRGATFVVTLPRDPRYEGREMTERPLPPKPPAGPISVLVIDDETALRSALLRFLQRRGIQGEGVSDGAAALRLLEERDFDVIISDVRMPGMAGREFVERLRRDRPELMSRLVFSTGDTFAPETAALLEEVGAPTVTKPFDFAALERVVREVAAQGAR
jgi:PAS domain S-box-containing protein